MTSFITRLNLYILAIAEFTSISFANSNLTDFEKLKTAFINSSPENDCYTTSIDIPQDQDQSITKDMDVLKIISPTNDINDLIATFHTNLGEDDHNAIYLVENKSGSLCSGWQLGARLADSSSMGYLFPYNSSYMFAYEYENKDGNTIGFKEFNTLDTLEKNKNSQNFLLQNKTIIDDPDVSEAKNVGTPSIENISEDGNNIDIKFHYYDEKKGVDKPGYGTITKDSDNPTNNISNQLNFDKDVSNAIQTSIQSENVNNKASLGKIGQRDSFEYNGNKYYIYEAQTCTQDFESPECWASWRLFLYSPEEKKATQLILGGCEPAAGFANPHTTIVNDNKLILSAFIPSETTSKKCNSAGEFIRVIDLD